MSRFTKEAGPCNCSCHDSPGPLHFMACCAYTYQPRAAAEAEALLIQEGAATTGPIPKIIGTDEEWEPGGRLGNVERYAVALDYPDSDLQIDEAAGVRHRRNHPE